MHSGLCDRYLTACIHHADVLYAGGGGGAVPRSPRPTNPVHLKFTSSHQDRSAPPAVIRGDTALFFRGGLNDTKLFYSSS